MSDVTTAFQMIDIILGHPGYESYCYVCNRLVTDHFGVILEDAGAVVAERGRLRHDRGGTCPFYVTIRATA